MYKIRKKVRKNQLFQGQLPWFVLVTAFVLLLMIAVTSSAEAAGRRSLVGRWHRLNPGQPPEHETLNCGGKEVWRCRYDKHPEPNLGYAQPPDATFGFFKGADITSSWVCPDWFPAEICANAIYVVAGEMVFTLPDGTSFSVNEELIVTESGGEEILYVYWVDQFECPWFRSFDEALAANPTGVMDCTFAP